MNASTATRHRAIIAAAAILIAAVSLTGCAAAGSGGSTPTPSPTPTPSHTTPAVPTTKMCTTAGLSGSVVPGSGGAAGSSEVDLALKNTGTETCYLQGWAGVSLVGDGNGTQLGLPAVQDRTTYGHATVKIAAGASAYIPLKIADASNYSSAQCTPQQADGFRVYTPGETEALFVASPMPACAAKISLLTVSAVQTSAR
jgi:hypothetical protein